MEPHKTKKARKFRLGGDTERYVVCVCVCVCVCMCVYVRKYISSYIAPHKTKKARKFRLVGDTERYNICIEYVYGERRN